MSIVIACAQDSATLYRGGLAPKLRYSLNLMADAPDKFEAQVRLARPVRILLATLVLAAALVFLLAGTIIVLGDRSQMPSPQGALVLALFLAALGLGFGFVGLRLIRLREATGYLFSTRAALISGALIAVLGLVAVIGATFHGMTDSAIAGIALIAIGYRVYRSGRQRQTASMNSLANHEAIEVQLPKTDAGAAPIAAANSAAPGAVPSSRSHALGWTVALFLVAVAAGIWATKSYRTAPNSQWLTSAQYQREFDTRGPEGFYPREVEGKCQSGGEKFRADWKAIPAGASFYAHHGLTRQDYARRDQEYRTKGYTLESVKQFKDCSGIDRYQATWLKR